MLDISKGEIVQKWRNGRTVQRVELKLDGDLVRDAVQREIVRQAKQQGVRLPDLADQYSCDPWLRFFTLSHDSEGYDDPFICHATLSFYEDVAPKQPVRGYETVDGEPCDGNGRVFPDE
jgi:hypothetical protein